MMVSRTVVGMYAKANNETHNISAHYEIKPRWRQPELELGWCESCLRYWWLIKISPKTVNFKMRNKE